MRRHVGVVAVDAGDCISFVNRTENGENFLEKFLTTFFFFFSGSNSSNLLTGDLLVW